MKLKKINKVQILSNTFDVFYDNKSDGGSFDWAESKIVIGTKSYKKDPLYTISVLSHELMEGILIMTGGRFSNGRTFDTYLFNFDHQIFANAIRLHIEALNKFLY